MCMNVSIADAIENVVINSYPAFEPSNDTKITIGWSYPQDELNNINGYYYTLTTDSSYTITASDKQISNKNQTEKTEDNLSDGVYYFYIAAYKSNFPFPEIGDTESVGPFTVDTIPPVFDVEGPETTSENPIELIIGPPDEVDAVCISEEANASCDWNDNYKNNFELTGEGSYVLKIQARDHAGNIATDSFAVTYTTADDLVMAQYTSVPTLSEWGMILFMSMIIGIGIVATRRIVILSP